jgi:hypothetical protein
MSMKNSSDTIGNDSATFRFVAQFITAPRRDPSKKCYKVRLSLEQVINTKMNSRGIAQSFKFGAV